MLVCLKPSKGRQEAGGRRQEAGGRRQEAGGRRQENDIKGGGRFVTVCKLYKHVICTQTLLLYRVKMGLSITTFNNSRSS